MIGAPGSLTGSSTSAPFKIQPCMTCSSVPSTASYTPTDSLNKPTALLTSHTPTAAGGVTLKANDATSTASAGNSASGASGTASITVALAGASGNSTGTTASAGGAGAKSSAGQLQICARGVIVLIGLWIATVVLA